MTTINTSDDLLELLRENREFREAARQAILSEELLNLPPVLIAFMDEVREYSRRTDERLLELEQGQRELRESNQELRQGQRELKTSVDSLRGSALEAKLGTKLIPLVGREFDVRRIYPIWTPGVIAVLGNTQEFQDMVEQATEAGVISDADEIRLRVTDLILRSQRKADRSTLWFAVEASGVINDNDITRAQRSASAIQKIYGQDAVPVVYGYQIHGEQMKLAADLEVQVFLDPDED